MQKREFLKLLILTPFLSLAKENSNTLEKIIAKNQILWSAYINHDFIKRLENETLSDEQFKFYSVQGYIFLLNYSKFLSYLSINAGNENELNYAIKKQILLKDYIKFTQNELKNFGINAENLSVKDESVINIAYSRYLQSVGESGDFLDTLAALAACLIGYLEIGENIMKNLKSVENHKFKNWILANSSKELKDEIAEFKQIFNEKAKNISEAKFNKLNEIFATTLRLEINFFTHALNMKLDL